MKIKENRTNWKAGILAAILLLGVVGALYLVNAPGEESNMNDFYNVNNGLGFDYLLTYGLTDEDGIRSLDDVWLTDKTLEEEDRSRICTPDGEPVQLRVNNSDYYFTVTYPLPEGDVTLVFRDGSGGDILVVGILPSE